jgi:hypothetical protein
METLMERTESLNSSIYGDIVPIAAIQQNIARVQAAKATVMKLGTHYGTIPGTPKPTLFKSGAEIINLMFGVSVDPAELEEETGLDEVGVPFYRARVRMTFKTRSGISLGASFGVASSLEEKYKWRKASGQREFDAAPEGRRRVKHRKDYDEQQVRTEVEDIRNTIVQMAMKRAEVSGTRRVHALSDMFAQDLEDLPVELRDSIIDGEVVAKDSNADKGPQPAQRKSEQAAKTENGHANGSASNASAPAAANGSANVRTGKIARVETKQGPKKAYWFVTLDDGFKCATFSEAHAGEAQKFAQAGTVVRIEFEPSEDAKYAPKLKSIAAA